MRPGRGAEAGRAGGRDRATGRRRVASPAASHRGAGPEVQVPHLAPASPPRPRAQLGLQLPNFPSLDLHSRLTRSPRTRHPVSTAVTHPKQAHTPPIHPTVSQTPSRRPHLRESNLLPRRDEENRVGVQPTPFNDRPPTNRPTPDPASGVTHSEAPCVLPPLNPAVSETQPEPHSLSPQNPAKKKKKWRERSEERDLR